MYSWGGSTADWKNPGGYDFNSARKPYLDKLASIASSRGERCYSRNDIPDMKFVNPFKKEISSESKNVIILAVDVTGSMASWPGEIFDRLPLFYQTLSQYRPDLEISFAAIGDATCDNYPLQVNNFGKGIELEDHLKALGCEGGGGGQISESYELMGYFLHTRCKLPQAQSPFLFIYGDEKFYKNIDTRQVKHYIGDKIQSNLDSRNVWQSLMQKFNLFYLQKPYGNGDSTITKQVREFWSEAIGEQRVIALTSCDRAVDVAMAIVARFWGEFDNFSLNIKARQDSKSIHEVENSIQLIPVDSGKPIIGSSKILNTLEKNTSQRLDL